MRGEMCKNLATNDYLQYVMDIDIDIMFRLLSVIVTFYSEFKTVITP
jgi:hypothetical protein